MTDIMQRRVRAFLDDLVLEEDRDREHRILLEHVTSGDPCDKEPMDMTEHAPRFNTIAYARHLWELEGGFTSEGVFLEFARDQQRLEIAANPAYTPWCSALGLDWAVREVWTQEQAKKREALTDIQERLHSPVRLFA